MVSSQTTLIFPAASTAICDAMEPPALVETKTGAEKVAPPSSERLNMMPSKPESLSQTTKTLPEESAATCGLEESAESLERLTGAEKVTPPSVEWLKKTSLGPGVSSSQTTLMLL